MAFSILFRSFPLTFSPSIPSSLTPQASPPSDVSLHTAQTFHLYTSDASLAQVGRFTSHSSGAHLGRFTCTPQAFPPSGVSLAPLRRFTCTPRTFHFTHLRRFTSHSSGAHLGRFTCTPRALHLHTSDVFRSKNDRAVAISAHFARFSRHLGQFSSLK